MANWHRFRPAGFEYESDADKLTAHGVSFDEAVECFVTEYQVRRNKRFRDRFQLVGRTVAGRRLRIIFQLKPDGVVRIITGWPL